MTRQHILRWKHFLPEAARDQAHSIDDAGMESEVVVTDEAKLGTTGTPENSEAQGREKKNRPIALWLGGGRGRLDMGFGRGPPNLEPHELLSWFFSRDGH